MCFTPFWWSPLSFLLSETCDQQVSVTNKVTFCQTIPSSENPSARFSAQQLALFVKALEKKYLLCLFKNRAVSKEKKTFLKDEKSVVQTIFKVLDLIHGGLDFAFSQCRVLPPLFTHLETKAIVKTAKGEGRGGFFVRDA